MAEPAKYLFDRAFEATSRHGRGPEATERRLREEFERSREEAEQAAFERGKAEGEQMARSSHEAQTAELFSKLVERAGAMHADMAAYTEGMRAQAARLAVTAATRLARELVAREPEGALEDLFRECLDHLGDAPHVAIRLNDALSEKVQPAIEAIAAERGFAGKIVVLGDPETRPGDCRIEWADGGVARDMDALLLQVEEIVARHVRGPASPAANGTAPEPKEEFEAKAAAGNGAALSGDMA